MGVKQALLDGEVVVPNPDGTTSFQSLQNVFQDGRTGELVYYVFDLININGYNVADAPLELRKQILKLTVADGPNQTIRFSDHLQGTGQEIIKEACRLHLEGIVCKRRDAPYRPGRGLDWLKVKCSQRAEFVVGGFTRPSGNRAHSGALLLGYYDRGNNLIYAGRVGTGFDEKTLATVHQKLIKLERTSSPFSNLSGTSGLAHDVSWVKPELVAEIEFSNWTDDRHLRHPSFQGLREDKPASAVIHDEPLSLNEIKTMTNQKAAKPQHTRQKSSTHIERPFDGQSSDAAASDEWAGVRLSHPDKILYPEQDLTKRDLAKYYEQVADWMLPHVVDRPLAIVRCPAGSGKPCFFQKHPGDGASNHLRPVNVAQEGAPEYHLAIDDVAGLIALVQMGVLEIHVWGSRIGHLEKPDRLIFDLDPDPSIEWPQVVEAARAVRGLLEDLGLATFLKTTGGKGLHVVVPVQPRTRVERGQGILSHRGRAHGPSRPRPLYCDHEQDRSQRKDLHRLLAQRPRRYVRRPVFHPCQARCHRERTHCLGRAILEATFRSLHDRKRAEPSQQAQKRSVGRYVKNKANDYCCDAKAPC